jgi:hypothetical protein
MTQTGSFRLPLRWSVPLGIETLLAVATAYALYALSGHVYCDQGTQDSRIWLAGGVLLSLPLTWLLASRSVRGARPATWLLLTVRLLLAAFVFLLLQPYSADWYMQC